MHINSNHSNIAFGREIDFCRDWLNLKSIRACWYSRPVIIERILQRLVEVAQTPYARAVKNLQDSSVSAMPPSGSILKTKYAHIKMGAGDIVVTKKQLINSCFEYFLHWIFCLSAIIFVKNDRKCMLHSVLIYGIGGENVFKDGSDEGLIEYFRLGPIRALRGDGPFFIEYSRCARSLINECFTYSKRPHVTLLRTAKFGIFGRIRLLALHCSSIFSFGFCMLKNPVYSLISRDFAYAAIFSEMDRRGFIDSVIFTTTNVLSQPLWTRAFINAKVHMIWYSQSQQIISYQPDFLVSDMPGLRWIRVDVHWVWTNTYAKYLRSLISRGIVEAVGPVVWSVPEISNPANQEIQVIVFDVPPFSDQVALECGEISNYFNPKNLTLFIEDLLKLKKRLESIFVLPVVLVVKMKRNYNPAYDLKYYKYLEMLGALGQIRLVSCTSNIYSLISTGRLVIAYPFTSPAYIADSLGVPSIYYDPTDAIFRNDFPDDASMIEFAAGSEQLFDKALSALNRYKFERM
ncbi:MAG: hypothetical protein Q7R66_12100 [Undibacterium sp.]|uniref:hypothetical protein n=1 Tax=Undibacterium sp. TaxID=1914977 RepID=UPI0027292BD5|nr:hypothetical protein [Undibacterium sp.]MDO8652921.1 hypothetical protein [Undibacterium sp.]